MKKEIEKLSFYLKSNNFHKESEELDRIIVEAGQIPAGMHRSILQTGLFGASEYDELDWIRRESEEGIKKLLEKNPRKKEALDAMGLTDKKIKQYQQKSQPISYNTLHLGLDAIGLIPGVGDIADAANAALYLSRGVTPQNILLAAISIASFVPGLDVFLKAGKAAGNINKIQPLILQSKLGIDAINKVLKNESRILYIIEKIKNKKDTILKVPGTENLINNLDQLWPTLKSWLLGMPEKIAETATKREIGEQVSRQYRDTNNPSIS